MNANTLLADPVALEIEKFVSNDDSIIIVVSSIQPMAICPQCKQPSGSLKSRYVRQLSYLPWHNISVRIELNTRKFRCRNELCPQKVFCERLDKVAAPYARRTIRLAQAIELLAFAFGARPASRTAAKLGFQTGKDIFLRAIRRFDFKQKGENNQVSVLGGDDFAFRRGINYGTILVNLENRAPIDLLPDRASETLSKWLAAHPEIETLSRDRSTAYAEAADRWHLLKNLCDLVERFFIQHHDLLSQVAAQIRLEHLERQRKIVFPVSEKIERTISPRRLKLFDAIKCCNRRANRFAALRVN